MWNCAWQTASSLIGGLLLRAVGLALRRHGRCSFVNVNATGLPPSTSLGFVPVTRLTASTGAFSEGK